MSIISSIARFRIASSAAFEQEVPLFEHGGLVVPVRTIRSPRARRSSLRVDMVKGEIRLTIPMRVKATAATRLLQDHRDWIMAQLRKMPHPRPFAPGAVIPFDGADVLIDWRAELPRKPSCNEDRLLVGGPQEGLAGRVERWLRAEALSALVNATETFASRAGCDVSKVRVGDPGARWGSCSGRAAIAYSWRLILAPAWVRESVVAHEVAHLVHLNHSAAFHSLHRDLLGSDPAPARQWLAAHGPALHWVGRSL